MIIRWHLLFSSYGIRAIISLNNQNGRTNSKPKPRNPKPSFQRTTKCSAYHTNCSSSNDKPSAPNLDHSTLWHQLPTMASTGANCSKRLWPHWHSSSTRSTTIPYTKQPPKPRLPPMGTTRPAHCFLAHCLNQWSRLGDDCWPPHLSPDLVFTGASACWIVQSQDSSIQTPSANDEERNMSMRDYLSKMKTCMDVLFSVGHKLSDEDQMLHVLAGQEANTT